MDLPEKLARYNGQYSEFQCEHSIFGLCRMNINSIRSSCLSSSNTESATCSLKPADCGNICSINTKHGVLIITMERINAFIRLPTQRVKLVADREKRSNFYFLPWTNYSSIHAMGRYGFEILPQTTLVDKNYVITPISDYVNFTLPAFHSIPTLKLQLDSLEAELRKQMQEVANISVNFKGLPKEASSNGKSIWTSLPMLLHALHIFPLYTWLFKLLMTVATVVSIKMQGAILACPFLSDMWY